MRKRWTHGLLLEVIGVPVMTVVLLLLSFAVPSEMGKTMYAVGMWVFASLLSGVMAYFSTRWNLVSIVAWLLPPVLMTATHWITTGYPPSSIGIPLVNAGVCVLAASVAQVQEEWEKNTKDRRRKKKK